MSKNEVLTQPEMRSFRVAGNTAYGQIHSYPLMISGIVGSKREFAITVTIADEPDRQMSWDIIRQIKATGVSARVYGRGAVFNLRLKKGEDADKVTDVLNAVARALRVSGAMPPHCCGICGRSSADTYILRNDKRPIYDAVHGDCVKQALSDADAKAEENPGSYTSGILGAALGAIVGIIPSFIGVYCFNVISAWLFMVLDVCINMEYGNTLRKAVAFTVHYTLVKLSPDYRSWLAPGLPLMLIFYAIGVFCSLRIIRKTNAADLNSLKKCRPNGSEYKFV